MEKFNPNDEKYKKAADLPEDQQEKFSDVEGGGFVKKEAAEKYQEAVCLAELVNLAARECLKGEKTVAEIEDYMKTRKITATDILHAEGIRDDQSKERVIVDKNEFLKGDYHIRQVSEVLRADRDVIMKALNDAKYPSALQYITFEEFKNDKEVMSAAVRADINNFALSSEELRDDKQFVLEVFGRASYSYSDNTEVFKYVSARLRDDNEIATKVLTNTERGWKNLEYLSDRLKGDKDFILTVIDVRENTGGTIPDSGAGEMIVFASEDLRKDKDVVTKSILNGNLELEGVADEVKNDKNFMLEIMKNLWSTVETRRLYKNLPVQLKTDKNIVFAAIFQGRGRDKQLCANSVAKEVPIEALRDREVALEVIKVSGHGYKREEMDSLPEEMINDERFILEGLKYNLSAMRFAGPKLRNDKNFIMKALRETEGGVYRVLSTEMQHDYDLTMAAVALDTDNLNYITEEMKDKMRYHLTSVISSDVITKEIKRNIESDGYHASEWAI